MKNKRIETGDLGGIPNRLNVKRVSEKTMFTHVDFSEYGRIPQYLVLFLLILLLAACGGSADTEEPTEAEAPTAEVEEAAEEESAEEMEEEPTSEPEEEMEEMSDAFPVTIEHKYGSTEIPTQPQRVVSVGYSEQDELLALGVVPVGLRYWYGPYDNAVWPWAQDELGDSQPEIIASDVINFEAIAALDPDLIVGITSGMTQEEYDSLSAIAPTLAQSSDYVDYGVPWQEVTRVLGQATGNSEKAETIVTDLEARFAEIRASHPQFDGASLAVGFWFSGTPGVYASQDPRPRLLSELGFVTPELYDEVAGESFFLSFSEEELPEFLDVDVVVWLAGSDAGIEEIRNSSLRGTLPVAQEGREIFFGELLGGAFSFSSPLSLDFLLDEMVPMLKAAVDGDAATTVPDASGASPVADTGDAGGTRMITDYNGDEVEVPTNPQRVVVLTELDLDSAMAVGVKPVGSVEGRGQSTLPSYLLDQLDGVTSIGSIAEPNPEAIAALDPDLILVGSPIPPVAALLPDLSQVAPVIVTYAPDSDWKTALNRVADALNRTEEAEAFLADYDARVAELAAAKPADLNEVTIVRWRADGMVIMLPNAFSSQVLAEVGMTRPEAHAELTGSHPVHTDIISQEQWELLDYDAVFGGGLGPDGAALYEETLQDPLMQALDVVANGHVVVGDGLVWGSVGGPFAALAVLDDVEAMYETFDLFTDGDG